jgi:hypothetical protein
VVLVQVFDIVSNEVVLNREHINHWKRVDQKENLFHQKQEVNVDKDTLKYIN